MYNRDAGYWHSKGKFEKEKPSVLLATIIRSDNYQMNHLSFRVDSLLKSLDTSIAFFIELLQIAYKNRENWQENQQIKAGIATHFFNKNATFYYMKTPITFRTL